MGEGCGHLAQVERVLHHKVMNAVGTSEVEAKQLEWPQPPPVHDLGLLQGIAWHDVAEIVNVGADKKQAELADDIGRDDNHHCSIDHLYQQCCASRELNGVAHQRVHPCVEVVTQEYIPAAPVQKPHGRIQAKHLDGQPDFFFPCRCEQGIYNAKDKTVDEF